MADPARLPDPFHLGVQPQRRGGALKGSRTEDGDLFVQAAAQPADGVLAHLLQPSCSTSRSTLRVEMPLTEASWTTATRACSARRRGSRKLGKTDPVRSLGMASSSSPTRVSQRRGR